MSNAYNPVGALGGLFAPAFIYGNPESDAAVAAWGKQNLKSPPLPTPVMPPVAPTGGGRGLPGTPGYLRSAGNGVFLADDIGAQRDELAAALARQPILTGREMVSS